MKISANLKKISTFLLAVFLVVFAFKSPVLALITDLNIDDSSPAAISDDGRYIVFFSDRTDLIIGDTNGEKDVFLYDRDTDTTERVNVDSLENESVGDAPIINWSTQTGADITPDGRYVVFGSLAPDLVAGDTNGVSDVFVRDRTLGTTEIVSVDDLGNEGDDASARGLNFTGSFSISDDGRYVTFYSRATNLVAGDTNGFTDVFVHDRTLNTTERVSVDDLGNEGNGGSSSGQILTPSMSSDGRYIVFISSATNLVVGDTNGAIDVFVHDRTLDTTERVSVDDLGNEGNSDSFALFQNISADGRYVSFVSQSSNLTSDSLPGFLTSVYVYDRNTNTIERVSDGSEDGSAGVSQSSISADGRYVAYSAQSNSFLPDSSNLTETFIYDRDTDTVKRVSDEYGTEPSATLRNILMTSDGRYAIFAQGSAFTGSMFIYDSHNPPVEVTIGSGVYENEPSGTLVGTLEVVDIDQFDVHTYSLTCAVPGADDASFSITGDQLYTQASFDYEVQDFRDICVHVDDGTGNTLDYAVTVFINDAVPTNINISSNSIQENQLANSTIGTLTTVNTEVTDTHTYSLTCAVPGVDDASFNISSNSLRSSASFDYETKPTYNICVRTTDDMNAATFDKNFVITVGDINEGGSGSGPDPVPGCTDSDASNYNPSATQDDDSCFYVPGAITGCTDPIAGNYNPIATVDNGSCLYGIFGCMDPLAVNYNPLAQYSNGLCQYGPPIDPPDPDEINGCMDPGALNYNPLATVNSVPCDYLVPVVHGCTDVSAINYNEDATTDDGSCTYTDPPGGEDPPGGNLPPIITGVTGFIKDNPQIPKTISIIGLLVPLLSQLISPGNIARLISIPIRIWNIIPTLLGFKRRKRPWGTVYDSITKQPLDPVYVMLKNNSGKEIATSITDLDGRYGFQVEPGQYSLFANKTNYIFPSVKLAGKTEDELYDNLYFGGGIDIAKEDEIINKNIPMDAINFNWNEFEKAKNKKLMKFYSKTELFLARISKILFIAGFISSIILGFVEPTTFNIIILALYVLILTLALFGVKPRAFGFVNEKGTGYPLSFGIISVFSAELGREVAHSVIGKTGKYYLLVPKGDYFVKLRKKTGEETYEDIYQSEPFTANKGYINKIIKV